MGQFDGEGVSRERHGRETFGPGSRSVSRETRAIVTDGHTDLELGSFGGDVMV